MSRLYEDPLAEWIEKKTRDSGFEPPCLGEIRKQALRENVPVAEVQTAALLAETIRMHQPEKILEIGCAVGYSSMLMAWTAGPAARIMTVDVQPGMIRQARANIERLGFENQIFPIEGRAQDVLHEQVMKGKASPYPLQPPYDLIFMDGPKGHYIRMLPDVLRLLKPGGVLIADNVLFRGMVAEKVPAKNRNITIVKRLRHFLDRIMKDPGLSSIILPVGDGVSISIKRQENSRKAESDYK